MNKKIVTTTIIAEGKEECEKFDAERKLFLEETSLEVPLPKIIRDLI